MRKGRSDTVSPGGAAAERGAPGDRTEARIVDAAIAELSERPGAGMGEIAARAGVGRATLYRHFPGREDLRRAIHVRAMEEAEAAVVASRPEEGPADAALERLLVALTGVIERYLVLARAEPQRKEPEDGAPLRERVVALIARGQREGVFTPEPSPELVAEMMKGLLMGSCAGGGGERGRLVARVLLNGLRTRD